LRFFSRNKVFQKYFLALFQALNPNAARMAQNMGKIIYFILDLNLAFHLRVSIIKLLKIATF
jgi:hypothetical protein